MTKIFAKGKYESLFPKKEKTIHDYYEDIRLAQDKIAELRSKCQHVEFEIHMYMWRPGAMSPQRICKACNGVIPGVTPQEETAAWDEWRKDFGPSSSVISTVAYPLKKD